MASAPIIDVNTLNLSQVIYGKEDILKCNPQRYEFEQLDSILTMNLETGIAAGCKVQKPDEFWIRGHIPGNPLMPGVLMIEMAAQVCSIFFHKKFGNESKKFFAFGGVDKIKFRGFVRPGDTLIMVIRAINLRSRYAVYESQGFANGKMVFEGEITGVII